MKCVAVRFISVALISSGLGSVRSNLVQCDSRQFEFSRFDLVCFRLPYLARFGSLRSLCFDLVWFAEFYFCSRCVDSVRFESVGIGSIRFGSVLFRWVWFGSVRFGLVWFGLVRFR